VLCRRQGIECVAEQLVASEEGLFCMALIVVVIVMILTVILEEICKAATLLSALMKVYTIPCHDRGHINVMLVLQSCSDSLHIQPSSSCDTNAASSDCAHHVDNMEVEGDLEMQGEETEVSVKTEKGVGSEEEECIAIKVEEYIYSEEEEEEVIHVKEKEDGGIKEEVSWQGAV